MYNHKTFLQLIGNCYNCSSWQRTYNTKIWNAGIKQQVGGKRPYQKWAVGGIQPARRPQGKKVPKRLDVSKLKQDSKRQALFNDICSQLDAMELRSDDPEENWTVFRDTVHFSNGFPRTSISQTSRLVWWEWRRYQGTTWRETPKTQGIP